MCTRNGRWNDRSRERSFLYRDGSLDRLICNYLGRQPGRQIDVAGVIGMMSAFRPITSRCSRESFLNPVFI